MADQEQISKILESEISVSGNTLRFLDAYRKLQIARSSYYVALIEFFGEDSGEEEFDKDYKLFDALEKRYINFLHQCIDDSLGTSNNAVC